ncbi:MAG: YybH family protein, partial [Anaerolineae bacterium]
QAIQAFWQAVLDAGIKEARLEIREVEAHGDTAIEVGEYTLHGEGGAELDAGKYIVIWKREGGQWKLHRDIFNSSLPAPG